MIRRPPSSPLFPYTPLFRSLVVALLLAGGRHERVERRPLEVVDEVDRPAALVVEREDRGQEAIAVAAVHELARDQVDRKSTRLNSSHANISYAVFCLKKKKN